MDPMVIRFLTRSVLSLGWSTINDNASDKSVNIFKETWQVDNHFEKRRKKKQSRHDDCEFYLDLTPEHGQQYFFLNIS